MTHGISTTSYICNMHYIGKDPFTCNGLHAFSLPKTPLLKKINVDICLNRQKDTRRMCSLVREGQCWTLWMSLETPCLEEEWFSTSQQKHQVRREASRKEHQGLSCLTSHACWETSHSWRKDEWRNVLGIFQQVQKCNQCVFPSKTIILSIKSLTFHSDSC